LFEPGTDDPAVTDPMPPDAADEARDRLVSDRRARRLRRFWRMLPGGARCKICTSPFGAPIGPLLRFVGKGRWPGNPAYCGGCFRRLYTRREGAEVECTMFFADIRGSTALAESMPAARFRAVLDQFYAIATETLIRHEAVVDKYVGDEVVGIFVPVLSGIHHARKAIEAALELLRALEDDEDGPRLPVGIGVHTGTAYVGAVGTVDHVEFTALGDVVNVTARLASAAGAGELLLTDAAAAAAGWAIEGLERRSLDLRGKSGPTETVVLRSDAITAA
jgi:adenylate cyclase